MFVLPYLQSDRSSETLPKHVLNGAPPLETASPLEKIKQVEKFVTIFNIDTETEIEGRAK